MNLALTGLKKRNAFITLVKKQSTKYLKHTQKFWIECPKTVEDTLELDNLNSNTMSNAISKEIRIVQVAVDVIEDDSQLPNGYLLVECCMNLTKGWKTSAGRRC